MDAFQQQHRYMRPPPATVDPYHHHQQQQQQLPPRPPVPPQGAWYPNQFQYHPSQSPSPPPPPQWAPPPRPHSEHLPPPGSSYPPPPPPPPPSQLPYPAHPVHHSQFAPPPPPPRPRVPPHFPPPPPPPHSQFPQSYPQLNQEWGTPNWGHQHLQGWDYSARSNEEDWAAKARAWADAKTAMENQNPQSQFTPIGRPEEQIHYREQYPQSFDSHYPEIQHQSHATSSYQHVPVSAVPPHQPPVVHPLETTPGSSEPSSYAPEGYLPHTARDETLSADPNVMFHHGENLPTSSSVNQQEVPSSYSSITGNEGTLEQREQLHKLLPLPNSLSQEGHLHLQGLQHMPLADQPLEFAPRYNHNHDPHVHSSYSYHDSVASIRGIDPGAIAPSMNSWTAPVAPGVAYPPMPPVMPSGPQQHDSSLAMPTSGPGHAAPPFSSFPGPGLPPAIPSAGPPFSLGAGATVHPSTAFSGDTYGNSSVLERPKKASVPNWLREEIKKAVSTNSSLDHPKEVAQSIEDGDDKYLGKGDQADSKSIDSSRSTEEEEDDEDYVEAARTAAINQEIKRVLTEVLLKVTDELFDEIATKVLDEDDSTVEVDQSIVTLNHKISSSLPAVPLTKATAKVIIPAKANESENEGIGVKSSSSLPGDVLGLANYATDDEDDDEDDEIQGSKVPNSKKKVSLQHINDAKPSEDGHSVAANDKSSFVQPEEQSSSQTKVESGPIKTSSIESKYGDSNAIADFSCSKNQKVESNGDGNTLDETSRSKDFIGIVKSELPEDNVNLKKISKDDSQGKETRKKPDKNDHEGRNSSFGKKSHKEVESGKIRKDEKGDDIRRRQDERHPRKEKTDERNGSKDRNKELSGKHGEKVKESESKRRSSNLDVKEDRKEPERQHKASAKDEVNRKREHAKDKDDDRSRQKLGSDSSRHKRRRSSSISSRGRNKDNLVNRANDSSSEASDDSKRKLHSRKRNSSPSPVKSRRRQVSRSPHSKHSQRRHSPYSSLDSNRRRSRSRTPVRRHR